jgi:hypothetical protein
VRPRAVVVLPVVVLFGAVSLTGCNWFGPDDDGSVPAGWRCAATEAVEWNPSAIHLWIGGAYADGVPPVVPLEDGDDGILVTGSQGATMHGAAVAVEGDSPPDCVFGRVQVSARVLEGPFRLYEHPSGTYFFTDRFYEIGVVDDFTMSATIGDMTVTRTLNAAPPPDWYPMPDASVDAAVDTGPPPLEATLSQMMLDIRVGETLPITVTYNMPLEVERYVFVDARTDAISVDPDNVVVPVGATSFEFTVTGQIAPGYSPIVVEDQILQVNVIE